MNKVLSISVTIATYKRRTLLSLCLNALANQTLLPDLFEIIVCDSFSDDGTDELIHQFSKDHPELKIKYTHTINVLAAKRNLGVKESTGDVVVFFDDDCVPHADCLKIYHDLFSSSHQNYTLFCGEVRFPIEWVNSSNYYKFRDSRHFGGGRRQDLNELDYRTIVVMNMAFKKAEFIEKIGTVDESFIGYGCEDQDLGWRLQKAGFSIRISRALIVHHELSGNIDGYSKKLFHTARDGMATLLEKNPSAALALGLKFKFLDPNCPGLFSWERIFFSMARVLLFSRPLEVIASKILTQSDGVKFFYFPPLYKYVLACAYVRGAKARTKKTLKLSNWYE